MTYVIETLDHKGRVTGRCERRRIDAARFQFERLSYEMHDYDGTRDSRLAWTHRRIARQWDGLEDVTIDVPGASVRAYRLNPEQERRLSNARHYCALVASGVRP